MSWIGVGGWVAGAVLIGAELSGGSGGIGVVVGALVQAFNRLPNTTTGATDFTDFTSVNPHKEKVRYFTCLQHDVKIYGQAGQSE